MIELAILSESPADEAGLLAFAAALIGQPCSASEQLVFRARGWPAIVRQLEPVVAGLACWAQPTALLVVADGNGSTLEEAASECRMRQLREAATRAEKRFLQAGRRVPVLVGVAYPTIEAWWLAAQDSGLGEAGWDNRGRPGGATYTKPDLKRALYGSEFASLPAMLAAQAAAGTRAAAHADALARRFPLGLAPLVTGLRDLRT